MARSSGFKINRQGIRKMMGEIQREMDKYPVTARVQADPDVSFGDTNVFNGPVIHGDVRGSQLAWGNNSVSQNQDQSNPIAPGFEAIAEAVVDTLRQLPILGVSDEDLEDASAVGEEVLNEVVQPEPDRGVIRRAAAALKGYLAPIATGAVTAGAVTGGEETARVLIERLSTAL
ncbi:hypothetical protein KN815_19830 [Streptomyces sp. 4503]|uniref:Uncharacterized protein n=1 Tax=Streptomyces niphimycinicus TaxID=2842201 RepID=A0ABS6CH30_9ACTN|nr:hypothetical protein [Streptomyces niphimycinicus]MBU3866232.1 hypothetical protein [Streptomyces niphimycinicus]